MRAVSPNNTTKIQMR